MAMTEDGFMYVGTALTSEPADLPSYTGGSGLPVDASAAQAAVVVADRTPNELTGYEFVQWPVDGRRLLAPKLLGGEAVWVNTSTHTVIAPIGGCRRTPRSRARSARGCVLYVLTANPTRVR